MSLKLGEKAPQFKAVTTKGEIDFYEWAGDSWVIFFSHPADFTPVCTTELGTVAQLREEWEKRNVKPIAVSVDSVEDHHGWVKDIEDIKKTDVYYPIIADDGRKVATLYEMIHPAASATHTVRSVFVIDPSKKIRLTLTYPAATGRNFHELLRVIDSLQLTDNHSVATPADWKQGERVIISPAIKDQAELKEKFPSGYEEVRPYLRYTAQPTDA